MAEDSFPPCWRNSARTTFQAWSFNASNNPAVPEQFTNPYGTPQASFAGSSRVWKSTLFGTKQGGWDLGQGSLVSLVISNCGGSTSSWKYVALQVTYFSSGAYAVPAVSVQPSGTQLTFTAVTNEIVEGSGAWIVGQWISRLEPSVINENVIITAAAGGALIDQVIVDTLSLESICPTDISANADPGQCSRANVLFAFPYPVGCVTTNASCNPTNGSSFLIGLTPVSCNVTDFMGRTTNCSFNVIVNDVELPTITAPAAVVVNSGVGQCYATGVDLGTPAYNDNCPGSAVTNDAPAQFPKGTTTVTWTVTDASGNAASAIQTVTVRDNQLPTIICPADRSMSLDPGLCTGVQTFSPGIADNCPGATVICTPPSGSAFGKGDTIVNCTVTDTSQNTATCSFKITLYDTEPPTITCPTDIERTADQGTCTTVVTFAPVFNDNCPGATAICTPPSGSAFAVGQTTVYCTVTDANSRTADCSFKVTVNDTQVPTITCPTNIIQSTDPRMCTAVVNFASPSFHDNCSGANSVCTPPSGSAFGKGDTTVNCTVTDASQNTATCSFTVTVNDTELPTINCPADNSVSTDPGLCGAIEIFAVGFDDNCPGASVVCLPPSGSTFPKGETLVHCTVTDASQNTATCTFRITVNDAEPPTIVCPTNIVQGTDPGACTALVTFVPTIADNCSGATLTCTPPSGSTFAQGQTTVWCVARDLTDRTAECTFTVTINDTEIPTITCPTNIIQNTDPRMCTAVVNFAPTFTDNCSGATVVCTPPSGSPFATGDTTVNCTVTDFSQNTATCSFKVTVIDAEPPTITCPGDNGVSVDHGLCTAVEAYSVGFDDNCPGTVVVCNPPSGSPFPRGETTVHCTAADTSQNTASCTFTITVNDVEPPTIICPTNTVQATDPGSCTGVITFAPTIADNCPGAILTCTPPSGSAFAQGDTLVYCVVRDLGDRAADCTFKVTVYDNQPPTLTCTNIVQSTDPRMCTAVVNFTPTINDNCPGATVVCTPPSGSVFAIGETNVNCTGTDLNQNTGTCTFKVTVIDTEPPTITCPGDNGVSIDPGLCTAVEVYSVGYDDNCPGTVVVCDPPSGSAFPRGETTVDCTATDASQNTSTCSFSVTVNDIEPPTIICPTDIVQSTDPGSCTAVVTFAPTVADNCPGVTFTCMPPSGSTFAQGQTTVYCVARDVADRAADCVFKVTVNDTQPPTVTCPTNMVQSTEPGKCTATVTFAPSITDNCLGATVVCMPPSGSAFVKGETSVNCTATDANQNTATCTFQVTVIDLEAPTIICPIDSSVGTDPGLCTAMETFSPVFDDNCPGATVVCTPPSGSAFPKGETTIRCTVTDASQNIATCSFKITVTDIERPTILCPADIMQNCDPGATTALVNFVPTFNDNCAGATLVCTPPSGSAFAQGQTTVYCTVTDTEGKTSDCTFKVNIPDITPPTLCSTPPVLYAVGDIDEFVGPEPSSPSGNQLVRLNGLDLLGFDESSSDAVFAHSFANLPSNISQAVLRMKLKASDPGYPQNDSILLGITAPDGSLLPDFWSRRIGTHPEDNIPGLLATDWVPGSEQEFVFDLSRLPSPANSNMDLIPLLGKFGYLDVYVQDDTAVDYMALEVKTCQCQPDIVVSRDSNQCGTNLIYNTPPFIDNYDPNPTITCSPPSGSFFPMGITLVDCAATDSNGNTSHCQFRVNVLNPPLALTIQRQGSDLVFQWSVPCGDNYELQQNTTVNDPKGWTTAVGQSQLNGNQRRVVMPASDSLRFFRLKQP